MPVPILIKRSSVAGKIPATTDLALGELAVNTVDGKLFLKKNVSGVETVVQVSGSTAASDITGSTLSANVTASSLTSVGTLTSLTVSGAVTAPSITKSGTGGSGDIGQSDNKFGTVYATTFSGTATTAQYADLAEMYSADADYEPGTVLVFGGEEEVTVTNRYADSRVAGVVSTAPAYLMNSGLETGVAIALRGRVPVKVIGQVAKGDLLVASVTPGYAVSAGSRVELGAAVFAKALGNKATSDAGIIEAVIL